MRILLTIILFCYIQNSFIFAQDKDSLILNNRFLINGNKSLVFSKKQRLENDPLINKIDYKILGSAGVAFLASGTYLHFVQSKAWWTTSDRFHAIDDPQSFLKPDKISHFYSVNLLGHIFSGGYEASGMQALESTWFSSLSALSYELYIELENGYHQRQGFSYSKLSSDLLGTAFYIGQYYFPVLKGVQPKISYRPSDELKKDNHIIFDDYLGQKYWLAIRAKEFLPANFKEVWPSFINLAVGTGVSDESGKLSGLYIALDLDAEELPLYGPFWQFVKNTLNYVHFPMPGIRINPKASAFLFCF